MNALNLAPVDIRAFVPARDFEQSKQFYQALGFTMPWSSDDLAQLRCGECSFLLQKFHVQAHSDNFMMHMLVENVDDWFAQVQAQGLVERFGARVMPPEDRPWGHRDFVLIDPTGVLWRIAQVLPPAAA